MCKSVKGAAYFGSSIHVVAAFIFLFWFLFDTVITEVHINLWRCVPPVDDPPREYNLLVHYLNLPFKLLYYMCLCVTGIYIFRGVERNAPRVIKFALLVFVIVQIIALAIFVTISLNYWDVQDHENSNDAPIASGLVDPNIPYGTEITNPADINYNSFSLEDSDENGNYSINIEIISHKPSDEEIDASQSLPEEVLKNLSVESSEEVKSLQDILKMFPSAPQNMVLAPEIEVVRKPELDPTPPAKEEIEEAVLESPLDLDLQPTTTSPMPMSPEAEVVLVKVVKQVPQKRLSHNQLVQVVFQVFLLGFNAVGSFIYTGVMLIHLTSL